MKFPLCFMILLAMPLALPSQAPEKREKSRFDGRWDTVLSCFHNSGAQGFSFRFPSM